MTAPDTPTRRAVVAAIGTLVTVGCLGRGSDSADSFDAHPATDELGDAPTLGPEPETAGRSIVAFEDPSCSSCASFASTTLPELRENAIDTGRASYIWRGNPVVKPWGHLACRALWAVWQINPTTFWALKSYYYTERDSIDADTVTQRTQTFLEDDGAVTPEPVVTAMDGDDSSVEDRIERDTGAATGVDVDTAPAFVLFREGEHVTTVTGNQPYGIFEGALEL